MNFPDLMLSLGICAVMAAPVLQARGWILEGFEDAAGFHFGPMPRAVTLPVNSTESET